MQSVFQYRRMLAAVKKDLARAQPKAPARSSIVTNNSGNDVGQPASDVNSQDTKVDEENEKSEKNEKNGDGQWSHIPGVTVSRSDEENGGSVFIVDWPEGDSMNPHNWSRFQKWMSMFAVCFLTLAITIPSSIDAPVAYDFNRHFGVSEIAGSMTTAMYLIGTGVGALFAGTVSETFGRNVMYMTTFTVFMIFVMAKALTPNYGAALVFRFLAGFFGSTPMTAAGGTIADMWTPLEMIFCVPAGAMTSYAGPIIGPIIGAYLPSFRWADWVALIIAGTAFIYVFLFQPETYRPVLLEWRAEHLRKLTGDNRFQVDAGGASTKTLGKRLVVNIYRPFVMTHTEPIILCFALYLIIIYFVLFTFLNGYPFIFQETYGISLQITFILWVALLVGDFLALPLIPLIYGWSKKAAMAGTLNAEFCLWFGMLGGSIMLPVSLWWMAWTCYPSVSIWVPIVGSIFFGYGLVTIFTMTFLYTCFCYGVHSASALAFMTSVRYIIAGAVLPASVPMYQNLGRHFALTIPAILATIMAPVPYLLYKYGATLRSKSKYAMQ